MKDHVMSSVPHQQNIITDEISSAHLSDFEGYPKEVNKEQQPSFEKD